MTVHTEEDVAATVIALEKGALDRWGQGDPMGFVEIAAPDLIREVGQKLSNGMVEIAKSHGHEMLVTGMPSMPYVRVLHEAGIKFHRALCGECTRRGAFFTSHHNWFLSAAHTEKDLQRTWDILDDAFKAVVI